MNLKQKFFSTILIIVLLCCNFNIYFANEAHDVIVPILMYHNLVEEYPLETAGANITPELFEKHIQTLLNQGYTPVSLSDYYAFVIGNKTLPDNPIVITFDDGYLSNYEVAFPILKK